MKNYYLKILIKSAFGVWILILIQSCGEQSKTEFELEKEATDLDSETEIRKTIEDLYGVYTKSDLKWVDFYKDEYKLASDDGTVQEKYADSLRIEWKDIYNRYDVILKERGKPIISVSDNQVFHYNTFNEIFIKKATKDTIENIGTWIVLWKKQKDNSWKIEFETYHAK
ncbi:hypothetical protein [Maribacter hydrothermalis]|uniref:DUF4440 domain-containing protein n=1 Tax=Maribacter hydrothermalis TaxID=1836467 RepID=A0A1B7Z418_9FLAO|nr:hypothetical protein [Maribacter hydrothermalis]APQ17213.1 hypothetical protein BTR34_07665 [Maribacter hydrothermalis]OBR37472.1 hypothetical protein A9200_07415 [Maribacter hydrothermalis]